MPPTPENLGERIEEIKEAMATEVWAPSAKPIGDLKKVLTYEPLAAPNTPLLTMLFTGFQRAKLESPDIASGLRDPLMGRRWLWNFDVRIWVELIGDEKAAQERMETLVPEVVSALEANRSLGGVAASATIASGEVAIMSPKQGQALLICTCKCAVETEEALT